MGCNIILSTIFVLSSVIAILGGNIRDRVCDHLLPNNRVSTQDYLNRIATGEEFLVIYSRILNPNEFSVYGKTKRSFDVNGEYLAFVESETLPVDCFGLGVEDFDVTEVIEVRTVGNCRKIDTYFRMGGDDQRIKTRFISQDLSKYFWWFECIEGGDVSSYESCTGSSVLQLHIKDTRDPPTPGTELNLNMFPWGLALQDLKDFTGLTISDLDFKWLGRECESDDVDVFIYQAPAVTVSRNSSMDRE